MALSGAAGGGAELAGVEVGDGYLTMRYENPVGVLVIDIVRLPFASCSVNIGCSGAPQPTRIDPSGWTRTLPSVPPL